MKTNKFAFTCLFSDGFQEALDRLALIGQQLRRNLFVQPHLGGWEKATIHKFALRIVIVNEVI